MYVGERRTGEFTLSRGIDKIAASSVFLEDYVLDTLPQDDR